MAATLITGAFAEPKDADEALRELERAGYTAEELSIISHNDMLTSADYKTGEGTSKAIGAGAIIGGLAGLVGAVIAFPAVAGLVVGGPIAAALGVTGAAAGAATGSLIGALTAMGLSRETATTYNEIVSEGGMIVGVSNEDGAIDEVRRIMENHGAEEVAAATIAPRSPAMEDQAAIDRPIGQAQPAFGERIERPSERTKGEQDTML